MNRSVGRLRRRLLAPLFLVFAAVMVACGKKGDPQPPFPRVPRAVSDLAVEQEGADAVLTFTYPDRMLSGQPLTDLDSVEIYRVLDPAPALTSPPPSAGSAAKTDEAPIARARRTALAARLTEEAFYREAKRIDTLPLAALARHTHGATIGYRDPLVPLFAKGKGPSSIAYAVVSVRRGGDRSPVSNLATLSPDIPPAAPTILAVTPEEGRICLEWAEPETDLLGRPGKVGGYFVYRRTLEEEEYGEPVNKAPIPGTAFVDVAPPYGKLLYTVRATLPGKPRIEGLPAVEAGVDYQDVFPPPAPPRLDALSEGRIVRLVWDPVTAPDLAGYAIFRAEAAGAPERLKKDLVKESFFVDETAQPGRRYRYAVRAVDTVGNMSPPSPEATAEIF